MPIYEFRCPGCGHEFERRMSFSDAERVQECPACGAAADRLLSLPAPPPAAPATREAPTCPGSGLPCTCGRADG